jgi:hypothetical protein
VSGTCHGWGLFLSGSTLTSHIARTVPGLPCHEMAERPSRPTRGTRGERGAGTGERVETGVMSKWRGGGGGPAMAGVTSRRPDGAELASRAGLATATLAE